MEIIEYFTADNKEHWLSEIKKSDWSAGQFLASLIESNTLKNAVGETTLVLMLVDGENIVSFCTFAPYDDIQPTELTPWIGFIYTFPEYRGHRYVGVLLDYAESIATIMGKEAVYISTSHVGLYEKYGYEFFRMDQDMNGENSRVYRKLLSADGPEKERRKQAGGNYKSAIVKNARHRQCL